LHGARARLALAAGLALALAGAGAALDVPFLAGRVNDGAGLLSGDERERLEATLAEIERSTGAQVAILTLESLEGEPIEDFSMRVAETWKLGRKDADDGVLIVVAKAERRMRIEVGYGLEATLTDAVASRIIDQTMRPRFRAGDFAGGLEGAVDAVGRVMRGEALPAAEATPGAEPAPWWAMLFGVAMFVLVIGLFSLVAVFSPGCQAWFLYLFLTPFYLAFPAAFAGLPFGVLMGAAWLLAFPVLKVWLGKSAAGRAWVKRHPGLASIGSSRGSSGSSRSGGFSGGGGSFGGGGASGSW